MSNDQGAQHDECMRRFIALANELNDDGVPSNVVSWALMTASGIYATYSVAGNEGGLTEAGVDKVAEAYKKNLANIQSVKKSGVQQRSKPTQAAGDASGS
jgi:hypothetical protein